MSHFLVTFWAFFRWSLDFLFIPPLVYGTLLLGLNFVGSVFLQRPFSKPLWRTNYSIAVLQFWFFPATLAIAVLGRVDSQGVHLPGPNKLGLGAEYVIAIGSVIIGGYWVWMMKGLRWFALSLAMLQLWLLVVANLIAEMSLTGNWL
jgi:hypothetical protein